MRLLSDNLFEDFFNEIPLELSSIVIISPYISLHTIEGLIEKLENTKGYKQINVIVITTFNRQNFFRGSSSLDAIQLLVEKNIKVYALDNLHTKAYIFNDSKCIVGSANFTRNGLLFNHELLVVLEQKEAKPVVEYAYNLLDKIKSNGDWLITLPLLDAEKTALMKLSQSVKVKKTKPCTWGANLINNTLSQNVVLSISAGDTINLIETFHIHSHPIKIGYNYKNTNLITFRRSNGGIMKVVYKINQKFTIDMNNWKDSIEILPISPLNKSNLINYIIERYNGLGFDPTFVYKFYILEEYISLRNEPKPEKNNTGSRYYDLGHLMEGNPFVYTL